MKNKRVHPRVEGCLKSVGLPFSALITGWFFGGICAFCMICIQAESMPDLNTGLLMLQMCLMVTPLHPSYWVFCALAVAWASISNDCESHLTFVCDLLLLVGLVILFGLGFGVSILEPDFVGDRLRWILIAAFSVIIVGLSILARKTLARMHN